MLQQKYGMARSVDLARHMGRDGGFLTVDQDGFLHLTGAGLEVAEKIYERHQFFTQWLIGAGIDPETAGQDACRMEHGISQKSFEQIRDAYSANQKQ